LFSVLSTTPAPRSPTHRASNLTTVVAPPRQTQSAGRRPLSRVWLALGVVYIAWGSTYVAIRIMDRTVPPLIGAGIRYVAAGLLMYAVLALFRRQLPAVSARELGSVALVGVLLLTGGNGF